MYKDLHYFVSVLNVNVNKTCICTYKMNTNATRFSMKNSKVLWHQRISPITLKCLWHH